MRTIIQQFVDVAQKFPNNIALEYRDAGIWSQCTYSQLFKEARGIAAFLAREGLQNGDAVIMPSFRSPSLCSALLGILWAGGQYVFVDPAYPAERQQFIAEEVGAAMGLFENEASVIDNVNIHWLRIPDKPAEEYDLEIPTDAEAPACVFFTSGSTGVPKGVIVPHRGIVRLVVNNDYISFSPDEVFLQLSTLSFDAATFEIWGALLNGGTCVLHYENGAISPAAIHEVIDSQGVTTLWLTSSLFNSIISDHPEALKSVRQLLTGGEVLSVSHIKKGLALLPDTKLYNGYGPTENTTFTTVYPIPRHLSGDIRRIPIGAPIQGTICEIFDQDLNPIVEVGKAGELIAFGDGVAIGYLNRPELTAERFIEANCADGVRRRGYRTGDLVMKNESGSYEFLQRNDKQVKIDGHRIEPGEIELFLNELENIIEARVVVRVGPRGQKRLAAYLVGKSDIDRSLLRKQLSEYFPKYMVPHFLISMKALPKNQNGKLDENQLPDPFKDSAPHARGHNAVAECWKKVLGRSVGGDENFIEVGGTSLEALQLAELLEKKFETELSATFVFEYPTIISQADYFRPASHSFSESTINMVRQESKTEFAITGMACRFPGADNVNEFWRNLLDGKETISFFAEDELSSAVDRTTRSHPNYVRAKGVINGCDKFDANFFGISPIEADIMDPQQRIMLEICWHALEDAGIPPGDQERKTGVFVGTNWARYYQQYVLLNKEILGRFGAFNSALANEPDFLSTRISYKLNLKGPSVNVFTACSTGLVAVAQACAAIEQGQCEQAIAGGISISTPVKCGYIYQEGNMLSPDGHCRPFDMNAAGTTFNDGAGAVVIKRRDLAEADGDRIYALIKGFAVNNDGKHKASFTAPSADGQVKVYRAAIARAGIDPKSVGFIETHGTGTPLGDPIEVQALCQCYAKEGQVDKACALGSVKSNIGHTIHASGIAGLIKATLAVKNNAIPPTLFFEKPNPILELERTPFFINREVIQWPGTFPRRAAVSSLGVGGTNAHVLIEEYKEDGYRAAEPNVAKNKYIGNLPLLLSAKTEAALDQQIENYHNFIRSRCSIPAISDIAYTTIVGRRHLTFRAIVSGQNKEEIIARLADRGAIVRGRIHQYNDSKIGFMFTGQGAQCTGMGKWLYDNDPSFRDLFDLGCEIALKNEGLDIKSILFVVGNHDNKGLDINQTKVAQPAQYLLEVGLAKHLLDRGCRPDFLIGHSIGEFAAATISGIFSFEDAMGLVVRRGALMQSMPAGQMLVVRRGQNEVRKYLKGQVCLAAVNAPGLTVLSGTSAHIQEVKQRLAESGITSSLLNTSHAFHSDMMDPIIDEFEEAIASVRRKGALVPIYSTRTGKLLKNEEAVSPSYWSSQLRNPVLFFDAVTAAARDFGDCSVAYVEVGPGKTLTNLVSFYPELENMLAISSLPGAGRDGQAAIEIDECVNRLWVHGCNIDWQAALNQDGLKKVSLPGYPFLRESHWLTKPDSNAETSPVQPDLNIRINDGQKIQETAMTQEQHLSEILQQLKELLEDVTGYDTAGIAEDAHFSEVGYDSLLLTQIATAIDQEFKVGITFRHLVEEYTCLKDLSEFIAGKVPMKTQPIPSNPVATAAPAQFLTNRALQASAPIQIEGAGNSLQELVNAQLRIMQLQLQVLSGSAAAFQTEGAPISALESMESVKAPELSNQAEIENETVAEQKVRHTPGTRITSEVRGIMLSAAQKTWIGDLMARYQKKFAKSKAHTQKYRKIFADPRTVSGFNPEWKEIIFPIVTNKSKGSKLWDIDGNELIDTSNGFGPIFFGHSPEFVTEAVKKQLELGIETGPQSPLAGVVAKLFCELTGNERCSFASTGSEAVVGAIRLARTVTGRDKVVMFEGSYHGIFDEVVNRPGKNYQALPAAPGITRDMTRNMLVLPWGEPDSLETLKELGSDLAAVLVEPVQSRHPEFHCSDYLSAIRKITEDSGTAMILDEVVTGFRVHPGGIRKLFNIDADLATYGKVVGGGYPIGIIGGKAKFMDALDGGYWQYGDDSIPECGVTFFAGTFVRHPLALAATKAVLERIKDEGIALYEKLGEATSKMAADAKKFIADLNCDVKFEEFASLFYISTPANAHWGHMLFVLMRMEGIHTQQFRPNFLTTAHTSNDIESILNGFKKSLALLVSSGFIDGDMVAAKRYLSAKHKIPQGARLGKNSRGEPAYFIEDPDNKGKYLEVGKP